MNISISHANVTEREKKMKENKARGPDNISLRLLKYARKELIPSLLFLYTKSAARNSVPASWKKTEVSALFKEDGETDKQNYRPICLLCVPGKLREQAVATTITTHTSVHNPNHSHRWAYKKGPLIRMLLVKMIED